MTSIFGLTIPLPRNLCETLAKELEEEVERRERERRPIPFRLRFHLQLTQEGRLNLVGRRKPKLWWSGNGAPPRPFRVVAIDVNSRHGVVIMAWDVGETVKRVCQKRERFKNYTEIRKTIKLLDKFISGDWSVLEELLQRLPPRLAEILRRRPTAKCAREIRWKLFKGMRKGRKYKVYKIVGLVRKLVRGAPNGRAIILLDLRRSPRCGRRLCRTRCSAWQSTLKT